MREGDIQKRFSNIRALSGPRAKSDFLKIAEADTFGDGFPNRNSKEAQELYANVIGDADLVIVDNLSTFCPTIRENDADSWPEARGKSGAFPKCNRSERQPTAFWAPGIGRRGTFARAVK
jgi:hypothetical protein